MSEVGVYWLAIKFILSRVDWRALYEDIRLAGLLVNLMLLSILIYSLKKGYDTRPKLLSIKELHKKEPVLRSVAMKENWESLVLKARSNPPHSLLVGIVEADSFVDEALKRMGVKGEHMADRLEKLSPEDVPGLNRLWTAHRVRNDLVHTPGFTLDEAEAERIISYYEEFLREIGAI